MTVCAPTCTIATLVLGCAAAVGLGAQAPQVDPLEPPRLWAQAEFRIEHAPVR